ncbi:HD domain-containing protein [Parafrankia colletiae]|uniref:HD domain-containing protein n=1 Tax=Parafrankia colletiae TaxID=573497 RepID=UPI000A027590
MPDPGAGAGAEGGPEPVDAARPGSVPTLTDAVALATRVHAGQLDKAGEDYIGHPRRVMDTVGRTAAGAGVEVAYAQMAAILHDVVEDSDLTVPELADAGYPPQVVAAVDALTHREDEAIESYLLRVAADAIAIVVKRADMADNSDPRRLARLPAERAAQLASRYAGRRRLLDDLVLRSSGQTTPGHGPATGTPRR